MVESKRTFRTILSFWVVLALLIGKIVVTGVNHMAVVDAIYVYHMECIREDREVVVDYDDREDFGETLWRLWDWSHKRIMTEDDYILIKPYIGQDLDEFVLRQNWS